MKDVFRQMESSGKPALPFTDPLAIPHLKSVFKDGTFQESTRSFAAENLGRFHDGETDRWLALNLRESANAPDRIRIGILRGLRGTTSKVAIQEIGQVALQPSESALGLAAIDTLGHIGNQDARHELEKLAASGTNAAEFARAELQKL